MEPLGRPFKLSIIVPVFNERPTIQGVLRQVKGSPYAKEILVVDDCSTDGTGDFLEQLADDEIRVIRHDTNRGKGSALRTGLREASGQIVLFQDADLEYDPADYPKLVEPIADGRASVVYGYRIWAKRDIRGSVVNYLGNGFLTGVTNLLYGSRLKDMEVGYKCFRADVIKALPLKASRFEIEPEITGRLLRRKVSILQVPVSYRTRTAREGKKIRWRDGLTALRVLLRLRFGEDW
ncbi:MAG: glycosyltransferase family 2 protein [Chloroflexi bacterium]|nr:glycosyltransferase family 2 protein [Chloroflexota bacterium]